MMDRCDSKHVPWILFIIPTICQMVSITGRNDGYTFCDRFEGVHTIMCNSQFKSSEKF